MTNSPGVKGSSDRHGLRGKNTDHNNLLNILIRKEHPELEKTVERLAEKNNPTLLSIKKVENLLREHLEFNSRSHLLRELDGSMKATVLNTIIAHLVNEGKLVVNDDHSLTWVDAQGNKKLNEQFGKAVRL